MDGNRLEELRSGLLSLHKALIEDAKRAYVAAGNPEPTPVEFWHLLINGASFQWLRRISEIIVDIDETQAFELAHEELFTDAGPEFSDKLRLAIERDPRCRAAWEQVTACISKKPN